MKTENTHNKITAIVLAAGQGQRMNSQIQKQYMLIHERPVLYYSLQQFQDSDVDEVLIVVGFGEVDYCIETIVKPYGFTKVCAVIEGGKERYESVFKGLEAIDYTAYVLIHDGARPMITQKIIEDSIHKVQEFKACVVGVPSKDTIKIVDENQYTLSTPNRDRVWMVQTPQSFEFNLIKEAYRSYMVDKKEFVTDDAMIVEQYSKQSIKLIEGNYKNIKITTPEDLPIAEKFLQVLK